MDRLPDRIDSLAEHDLARNLLDSIADAPPGDDASGRLLESRVSKLLSLGDVRDAAALARAAPNLPQSPGLARAEIKAELLSGQIEMACIDYRALGELLTDTANAEATALCRHLAGDLNVADMPQAQISDSPNSDDLGAIAVARLSGTPLPVDTSTGTPPRLVAAAHDEKLSPEIRLEAAFAAGRASAMPDGELANIFRTTPVVSALTEAPPGNGAEAAALFQAIEREGDTRAKIGLVSRGLLSPNLGTDSIGLTMAAALRDLQPVPELGPLAATLAQIYFTLGDIDAATPWAELADQSGNAARLWPYRVLVKQADATGIGDWEQQSNLPAASRARILAILSAFGITAVPKGRMLGDDQPEPELTDLLATDRAARNGHVGETTLRALALLGRAGPTRAHPLALQRALANLDQAFLHTEARALAFEAITAALVSTDHGARP